MITETSKRNIESWMRAYVNGCGHPDFQVYSKHADLGERFQWLMNHLIQLGGIRSEHTVLDIGAGFGWQAAAISLMSNCKVIANDIRPYCSAVMTERIQAIREQGAQVSIEPLTGDICEIELEPVSFDAIICNQTIEHVHDLESMFAVCHRVLKSGGKAVFTNSNNVLNAKQFAEIREMWHRRDADWDYIKELYDARPIDNHDSEPFRFMRARTIRYANPNLNENEVDAIAQATAGMVNVEIENFAKSYKPGDQLPVPSEFSWCRNPTTGEYCERQLNPYEVAEKLEIAGFKTSVRHGFRRKPWVIFNGVQFGPLNRFLFQLRPLFIVVARKTS